MSSAFCSPSSSSLAARRNQNTIACQPSCVLRLAFRIRAGEGPKTPDPRPGNQYRKINWLNHLTNFSQACQSSRASTHTDSARHTNFMFMLCPNTRIHTCTCQVSLYILNSRCTQLCLCVCVGGCLYTDASRGIDASKKKKHTLTYIHAIKEESTRKCMHPCVYIFHTFQHITTQYIRI